MADGTKNGTARTDQNENGNAPNKAKKENENVPNISKYFCIFPCIVLLIIVAAMVFSIFVCKSNFTETVETKECAPSKWALCIIFSICVICATVIYLACKFFYLKYLIKKEKLELLKKMLNFDNDKKFEFTSEEKIAKILSNVLAEI